MHLERQSRSPCECLYGPSAGCRLRMPDSEDARYAGIFLAAIRACRRYKPKFGGGSKGGLSLPEFRGLYGNDPFYGWLGLDSPLVYGAHKAAGGMTSLYRQIGLGSQLI